MIQSTIILKNSIYLKKNFRYFFNLVIKMKVNKDKFYYLDNGT